MRPTTTRGFARGFSIQTVSPLPIGWAEHVLAEGHFGTALREYMRDYNHWTTIGVLNELLPQPENRVTLADGEGPLRDTGRAISTHTRCENDKAQHGVLDKEILKSILQAAGAQDILTIQRYAHLIGGCRMGTESRGQRRRRRPSGVGRRRTCSSPTAASVRRRAAPTRP